MQAFCSFMQGQNCYFQLTEFIWDAHKNPQKPQAFTTNSGFFHMPETQLFRRRHPTGPAEKRKKAKLNSLSKVAVATQRQST